MGEAAFACSYRHGTMAIREGSITPQVRHLTDEVKVPVVVQEQDVIFQSDLGNQTIHRTPNGQTFATAGKINFRGGNGGVDGVQRMEKTLGLQIPSEYTA